MTVRFPVRQGERGAVAIMVALAMVVFIGLLGIVIDLGMLYIRKTELQNAADAAALAGAKRLDGTLDGINTAVTDAVAMAAFNATDFDRTEVSITDANIQFAPDPDGPWSSVADSQAQPLNKRFIKVDTTGILQGTRPTLFMRAISASNDETTATALAVAGAPICENLPMFVCAPDPAALAAGNWGFVPGQGYELADKPGGPGPGNVGYMDPVQAEGSSFIDVDVVGVDKMRRVMCQGKTLCITPGIVKSRTQNGLGAMPKALNTRFDDYTGLPKAEDKGLTPEMCPPDTNIQEYAFSDPSSQVGTPQYWMDPAYRPTAQADEPSINPTKLGVHWSAVPPPNRATSTPLVGGNYPTSGTPYSQPRGTAGYHKPPRSAHEALAQPGRRIITMAIATNCMGADGKPQITGSNFPVEIASFAQFLMPVPATGKGGDKGIFAEFIKAVPSPPSSIPDIKLYR